MRLILETWRYYTQWSPPWNFSARLGLASRSDSMSFIIIGSGNLYQPWWRHQIETVYTLLTICVGNSPVSGEFPAQRPVTRSFDVFFDLCLNKRLNKQSWGWWFETLSCSLWRQCNDSIRWYIAIPWHGHNALYIMLVYLCLTRSWPICKDVI